MSLDLLLCADPEYKELMTNATKTEHERGQWLFHQKKRADALR